MTDWSQLEDAFGSADGIPALLDRFEAAPSSVWPELMDRLCPQLDTAFTASFAALPRLAEIASGQEPERRSWTLLAAGPIVSCARRSPEGMTARTTYAAEIEELARLTDECLHAALDSETYLLLLQTALACEDVAIWDERLDGMVEGEYEVECPHCGVEVFLVIGAEGRFSAIGDYARDDIEKIPLRPTPPQDLDGVAKQLYERALRHGQREVAEGFAHLFGEGECGDCRTVFPVATQVAGWLMPTVV
ncbi:hypothetical protein [Streptomyces albipurpureus]|uniref:Uncharacterized protein n=1 Tax=Streptomyces albipurpureus TaxID=2897419 RepID=A0ABT0UUE0_9ACTN|nr:hypothetical protein [Streptomyces sp. CWNU-1]MCM2390983.1 hypothetical protein [Streptomyces sp. CWNU-1]